MTAQARETIVVIGTGYVGLPAALMWAKAGHRVIGVDIDENLVRSINERTMLLNEAALQALLDDPAVRANLAASVGAAPGDVFVIAVPTPVDPLRKIADLSAVEAAIESIAPHLRAGSLVIVESTVPPLTCRGLVKSRLEALTGLSVPRDIGLAHCPERILPGDVFNEIVRNDRLIGGLDRRSAQAARRVYASFVEGELIETSDLVAELAKLMENAYRDVNIALANEFAAICEGLHVDWRETIALANRHPRVDILTPGIGVGGHCIPVDPWFLKQVAPYDSRMITAARLVNDEQPARIAARIRRELRDVADPVIVALGATYKRNCEDLRESPARRIVALLREDGYDVRHHDPLVPSMAGGDLAGLCRGADLVVLLVAHDRLQAELRQRGDELRALMRRPRFLVLDSDPRLYGDEVTS